VLGLASIFLFVFRPGWAVQIGLDLWNLPELERTLAAHERFREELERKDEAIIARVCAKDQVIHELLAEGLTLTEAAAHFRRLNAAPCEFPGPGPAYFPGETESERYCRQVLQWVDMETLTWERSDAEELRCRLEAELEAFLMTKGSEVALPGV